MSFNFPNSPTVGQIFSPAGGPSYTWNGTVWAAAVNPGGQLTADSYNRIVNGAMQHSQENSATDSPTSSLNNGYYSADQWFVRWSFTGTAKTSSSTGRVSPNGNQVLTASMVVANGTLGAAQQFIMSHHIEGNRVADFGWGAAGAKQIVVRFWFYSTIAGTYHFRLTNNAVDRCYIHPFSIPVASTWYLITAAVPGDTTGTWLKDT